MTVEDFQKLEFDETRKTLLVRVNEKSEFATRELIMEAQFVIVAALEARPMPHLLVNLIDLRFAVPVDVQEWLTQVITPRIFALGVTKTAYIMPTEFIENLSIEQVHDSVSEQASRQDADIGVCYFAKETEAFEWFAKGKVRHFA